MPPSPSCHLCPRGAIGSSSACYNEPAKQGRRRCRHVVPCPQFSRHTPIQGERPLLCAHKRADMRARMCRATYVLNHASHIGSSTTLDGQAEQWQHKRLRPRPATARRPAPVLPRVLHWTVPATWHGVEQLERLNEHTAWHTRRGQRGVVASVLWGCLCLLDIALESGQHAEQYIAPDVLPRGALNHGPSRICSGCLATQFSYYFVPL